MAMKEVNEADAKQAAEDALKNVSTDERIGFHKGALSTLVKEREEMAKILGIVEQLMQMHVSALKELGVDLEAMAKDAQQSQPAQPKVNAAPLEDVI
ncbi:hypothetical protein HN587_07570 [Candidatus Woesearchaeota archaeon]|jgi:hypothetical protein|nr:hypothetical protein [Candidatus Woesearchaeota archaeon]